MGFSFAIRMTRRWISVTTPRRLDRVGMRPFPRDELPMPAQNCIERDDRRDLTEAATP